MKRRGRAAACLVAAALAPAACERRDAAPERAAPAAAAAAPARAARAVLVTLDTLRADRVGAYGAGAGRTPTLDALAERGARFERAVSPAPITLPSHATLLTGLDPPDHGVHHNGRFRLADDVPTLAAQLRARGFATAAFVGAYVLDARFGLARGFDVYDDDLEVAGPARGATAVAERPADAVVDAALAWLERAPDRFFVWIHLYDPHAEHRPPEPWASRFTGDPYAGEIAFADAQLGRLLAALEARWSDGATLVAATSDHGESLGEHGEATHAYTLYEATQRVPLLLAGPGVPAGAVVRDVVALADVAPTLLDLLGEPALPGATGTSLRAALAGDGGPPRAAYLETLATQLDWGWSPLFGLRTARHKYVRAPRPELYDLERDPGELHDLAASSPALVAELDRLLDARLAGRRAAPSRALAADERARLEALGYVAPPPGAAREPGRAEATPLGAVGGTDPKDELHLVGELHRLNELLGERRYEEALAVADRLGERGLELRLLELRAALGAGRRDRVERLAARLLEDAPALPETHAVLGMLRERAGDAPGARAAYERALALGAPSAAPLTGLGRLAEAAGRLDESRAYYERARGAAIPEAEPTWRLAALELEAGRLERGSALLLQLPHGVLRREDAALRVASAELAAGRTELARLRLDAALRDAPGSPSLRALRGAVAEAEGDWQAAREAREAWLRAAPEDPAARNDLAWTLAQLGRELPRARRLAEDAVEATGRAPGTLDTLAAVLVAQGDFRAALARADEGLARGADGATRARLLYRRAEALAGLARREEARDALGEARAAAGGAPALRGEDARVGARVLSLRSGRPPPGSERP